MLLFGIELRDADSPVQSTAIVELHALKPHHRQRQ